jgi:hypothetical protein
MWLPRGSISVLPDKPFDLSQNRVLFPSSSVPMSSGKAGLWQRESGAAAVEAQENLLSHPMVRIHGQLVSRASFFTSWRRVGSMSVCSDGAVAPGAEPAHGLAHSLKVEMSAVLLLQRSQMTRTRGITTTSSAFYTQTTGASVPVARDHEASMALMQTCRSSG